MSADELAFLTIAEAGRLIARRALSPVDLVKPLIARAEALEPQLHAYLRPTFDAALEQARRAEGEILSGGAQSPLHGIPYGLKDVVDAAGLPTTGQSRVYADGVAREDAEVTARLRAAGAILLGKLTTHEGAHGGPSFDLAWPPARNPWNTEHFTGGSSSGSGAAVAAGLMPLAIGSDTGGSVRNPAGFCGLVGLKPTSGLVSRRGVMPNSFSLDHVGPLTWTVEDCAIALQAMAGHDPRDPASAAVVPPDYRAALTGDIRGLRVGVLRHLYEEEGAAAPATAKALEEAFDVLRRMGARLEEVRIRSSTAYNDVKIVIGESEIHAVHAGALRERPGDFGEDFLARILPAILFRGPDYVQAQRLRRMMMEEFDRLYERFDVLVTAAPSIAPRLDAYRPIQFWRKATSLVTPFNIPTGPALAQCIGFHEGLPLSMQVAARPFDEATVLRVAHAYERATNWRSTRPQLDPQAPPPVTPAVPDPEPSSLTQGEEDALRELARSAGLVLPERAFRHLCSAAPYAQAMVERLRAPVPLAQEPAYRIG
ncbi:amidase [Roseomonas populi]|uniref:Amidase n=1 Tax=Roseomonas populi TaxID=3121582 RepID=A0ABT1XA84_9PROT|nr:amidase [Roseomonas pecuniae]MCR0985013.1 amidase [Roseomonas pecuniae]